MGKLMACSIIYFGFSICAGHVRQMYSISYDFKILDGTEIMTTKQLNILIDNLIVENFDIAATNPIIA